MSNDAHADHGHGHGHGKDHFPHVSPLTHYIKTWLGLMVLTFITVAVSRIDLGTTTNLLFALFIATIKAGVVAALFMHLSTDKRFHTVILISSVVFLSIFVVFTTFDTNARGRAEAIERDRPHDSAKPWEVPTAKPSADAAAPGGAAPAQH